MDVCDINIRKEDESCHQALVFKVCQRECGLELGEPRLEWQETGRLQRQALGSPQGLGNGKASWVATGSHGGHFMCWAQLQNSSNSNFYSHFLNTKSFLLPTYDCSEAKCTLQPYQNKFGKHMEENYWVTVTEPGRLIHEWKAGTYSSCLVRLF